MIVLGQIAIYLLLVFQLVLLFILLALVSIVFSSIISVPWVPTRQKLAKHMFELAKLQPGETVVDFGCGDGSVLFTAVKDFGAAKGIGYENQPFVRWLAKIRLKQLGLKKQVDIRKDNFFRTDFPKADVIATYLFASTQAKLEPLLKKAYPKGTRVVSRTFRYPTLELVETTETENGEKFYLYRI